MKRLATVLLLVGIVFSASAQRKVKYDHSYARDHNVCKKLKGDVLLYLVFVDSKYTKPWTYFDIASTLDSAVVAMQWIEQQAKDNGQTLNISLKYFYVDSQLTVYKDLPKKSLYETLEKQKFKQARYSMNQWADAVAKKVGEAFERNGWQPDKHTKIKNKERLIAKIRDDEKVESVALMFMLNNYYKNDCSAAFNTSSNDDVEFAVTSYKNPKVIAHEFLHLFGSADMYNTKQNTKDNKLVKLTKKEFPNEVMTNKFIKLEESYMSPITKYLIGWDEAIDENYRDALIVKIKKE
jgi:hypothetical protein